MSDKDRLLSKMKIVGSCWQWQASVSVDGYGHFGFKGESCYAHRVAFLLFNGPLNKGDVIRHTCDNPGCINPKHLLKGSHSDNVRDRVKRGRSARAEANGRTKLTREIVEQCRKSSKTYKELAQLYSVSLSTMRRACISITWQ